MSDSLSSEQRTSLQSLADNMDCETYRVLRLAEANIRCYPEASRELRNACESLRIARASFRQLMHPKDLEGTT